MTNAIWPVQELSAGDWEIVRDARLAALRESPGAFMGEHHHEASWGEWEWRRTFDSARWLIVNVGGVVGILHSVRDQSTAALRYVESIWVAPAHRQRGVFRCMLRKLAATERKTGACDLTLWVLEDNHEAQQAYKRLGFIPTGQRQALPDTTNRFERRFRLDITQPLSA